MSTYQFGNHIGRGGMADVFFGVQRSIGGFRKLVVLKRILPSYVHAPGFRELFLSEARLAASIHHSNIVEIYDVVDDDGLFIAMEFVLGLSLSEILSVVEEVPPKIVARIAIDVASALDAAHNARGSDGSIQPIVHLDVTPSNIILSEEGSARLLDFGIALASDASADSVRGKPGYISPEQILEQKVEPRSDIYQIGLVMHELLTGRRVFNGSDTTAVNRASLTEEVPAPATINPAIDLELSEIVMGCLERNLDARTPTARKLRVDLLDYLRKGGGLDHEEVTAWLESELKLPLKRKRQLRSDAQAALLDGALPSEDASPAPSTVQRELGETRVEGPRARKSARRLPLMSLALSMLAAIGVTIAWKVWPKSSLSSGSLPDSGASQPAAGAFREDVDPHADAAGLELLPIDSGPLPSSSTADAGLPSRLPADQTPRAREDRRLSPDEQRPGPRKARTIPATDLTDPWATDS